jgi:hypothetical protein
MEGVPAFSGSRPGQPSPLPSSPALYELETEVGFSLEALMQKDPHHEPALI